MTLADLWPIGLMLIAVAVGGRLLLPLSTKMAEQFLGPRVASFYNRQSKRIVVVYLILGPALIVVSLLSRVVQ